MKEAQDEGEYSGEGNNNMRRGRSYRRSYDDGESYARGCDPRTGRYVSRDMEYSGHYPMDYIDPMYYGRRY